MTRLVITVGAVLLLGFGMTLPGQENRQKKPSFWMEKKLSYSQNVLHGLATSNFEKIGKSARAMRSLNQIEHFVRHRPEGYRTQLKVFQFSVEELVRHSEDRDLDGATLAFTQMTLSCINCHKQLRTY